MRVNNLTTEIFFISADVKVRYWNDSNVNGNEDVDFYETKGEGCPLMPCAVKIKEEPESCIYSDHWRWRPVINIETGQILNWQKGTTADVFYKVCDGFACSFDDKVGEPILNFEGYVPSFMCPKDEPDGDYIIMDVDDNGYIKDWEPKKVKKFIENID